MRSSASVLLNLSPIADAIVIAGVFAMFWNRGVPHQTSGLFVMMLVVPFWLFLLRFFGLYESQRVEPMSGVLRKMLSAHVVGFAAAAIAAIAFLPGDALPAMTRVFAVGASVLMGERWAVYTVLHRMRRRGRDTRGVCVIGTWEKADELAAHFRGNQMWGFRVACVGLGGLDDRRFVKYPGREDVGRSLTEVLSTEVVDEVLVAVPPEDLAREQPTLRVCDQHGVIARLIMDDAIANEAPRLQAFCGQPSVALGGIQYDDFGMTMKRLVDLAVSTALLIVLSPLLLAIAIVVKLSSPGPVIFKQLRTGLHGRKFTLYKFRTMVNGAETLLPSLHHRSTTGGPVFKDPRDLRVTRVGRELRRFSLDELPQLFNVIKGDMSLVGPRPLPVHESAAIIGTHRRRFNMRPGITCLWQVNGRSNVTFETWMNYDLQYVDRWSLSLDAKLLLRTIPAVLSGRGAY